MMLFLGEMEGLKQVGDAKDDTLSEEGSDGMKGAEEGGKGTT